MKFVYCARKFSYLSPTPSPPHGAYLISHRCVEFECRLKCHVTIVSTIVHTWWHYLFAYIERLRVYKSFLYVKRFIWMNETYVRLLWNLKNLSSWKNWLDERRRIEYCYWNYVFSIDLFLFFFNMRKCFTIKFWILVTSKYLLQALNWFGIVNLYYFYFSSKTQFILLMYS